MSPKPKTATIGTASIAFAERAVVAKPEPDPIVSRPAPVPEPVIDDPPCALESAPLGAKCVVSRTAESGKKVRLLTPEGVVDVAEKDIFYTLPAGAKVRKVSETHFEAFRLGVQEGPVFTCHSARDAVTMFLKLVA